MPVTVVVGCQFGDEGKGKVVDLLARRMDWVARYAGGANAGHTVKVGRHTFVLHLIPSGILNARPRCIIGHGVVVDPDYLVQEMDELSRRGIRLEGRLFVSEGAHALLPYHRWLETLDGQDVRVGTTRRGIGPAYEDKVARWGIRLYELLDRARLRRRLEEHAERLTRRFRGAGQEPPRPLDEAVEEWLGIYQGLANRLRPLLADTIDLLHGAMNRGERILCEGAQGTFLDLDFGTYPYVTSSTTTAGGAASGLGLPPRALKQVIGVCKAYATRVGEGPFPTELIPAEALALREKGDEFGATTGRPRRVGWCDLVQVRQAVRINGLTSLVLTKLDVLSDVPRLRLCVAYQTPRGRHALPPVDTDELTQCQPEWIEMEGWSGPIQSTRRFRDLPPEAQRYIERIEAEVECPIRTVSIGSSRSAILSVPLPNARGEGERNRSIAP